ncbi:MAG: PD-(D/E)XK nuclease family protein [Gammaproteobacteria bacterium]|nr:PD-(D/E)XK nuclease family protein [Gammaproteobacteria bacterium]
MDSILSSLTPATTLITVNQRLARHFRQAYDQARLASGDRVWPTPDILPWDAFVQRCWLAARKNLLLNGKDVLLLLTGTQELAVWEQIINESRQGARLLRVTQAARQVREAWGIVHGWRIELKDPTLLDEDSEAFLEWSDQYRHHCREKGWLDHARLPDWLSETITEGCLQLPAQLLLAGFDELSPQQQALLEDIRTSGCHWQQQEISGTDATAHKLATETAEQEIHLAARWAKQQFIQAKARSIAIVVPDLRDRRALIIRIFDEHLAPTHLIEGLLPEPQPLERPYNISLGTPLADTPVVQTALTILRLAMRSLPSNDLTQLLCAPFLAGAQTEVNRRALLDAKLRKLGELRSSPRRILYLAGQNTEASVPPPYHAPILAQIMERLIQHANERPARQPARAWAAHFMDILNAAGWPGERRLSSNEYQAVMAWHELLDQFCQLEAVLPTMEIRGALSWLRRLCNERLFQPESGDKPIQVLGLLEAAGMGFDQLWMMGLNDEQWPPPPRPNPFLPMLLQQQAGAPRCSAERELRVAQHITERLLHAAPRVVVSSPLHEGDRNLRPSPLIEHLDPWPDKKEDPVTVYWQQIRETGQLEPLQDRRGPPLTPGPAPGGSDLFRDQAQCPFRAFARHRLQARPLESVQSGLNARDRGILIHRMLDRLWEVLGNQQSLLLLDAQALQEIINPIAGKVVQEQMVQRPDTFSRVFSHLERRRLERLARDWLEIEQRRSPFTVSRREARATLEVAGLLVKGIVDRVDRLADGRSVIIDYKSGNQHSARHWLDERLDEPQLPLYTLALDRPPAALLFAQLKPGSMAFKGLAEEADIVEGITAFRDQKAALIHGDWDGLVKQWRKILEGLAREFLAGEAQVTPKTYPESCRYCDLPTLCRINELREQQADIYP